MRGKAGGPFFRAEYHRIILRGVLRGGGIRRPACPRQHVPVFRRHFQPGVLLFGRSLRKGKDDPYLQTRPGLILLTFKDSPHSSDSPGSSQQVPVRSQLCVLPPQRSFRDRSLLYDVENNRWSDDILLAAGLREDQLPEIVPTGTVAGKLLPDVAASLGLSPEVRVLIGANDQLMNTLGSGVSAFGEAMDNSGTVECLVTLFNPMPEDIHFHEENYNCIPYLGRGYVTYAYNISAGSSVRWFRDAFGMDYDKLNLLCPEEPTELMVLPFLQGMGGTPEMDQGATGTIMGLKTSTRLPELYRALLEGITFEMRYNRDKLNDYGVRFDRLFACGGGARSDAWMQIKADILGCDITRVDTRETGTLGGAILGMSALTGADPFDLAASFVRHGRTFTPDPARCRIYEERYSLYKKVRSAGKGQYLVSSHK